MKKDNMNFKLSFIWTPILIMISLVGLIMAFFLVRSNTQAAPLEDFDQIEVKDGFHEILLPTGQRFTMSYEKDHDRVFEGIVRHTSMNHETSFPIISYDILVTSGDYADFDLVSVNVESHHFTWYSRTGVNPNGSINLLHTVPVNQAIEDQLAQIKKGDHVVIKGWDILKINSYSSTDEYLGTWQDAGCNTLLITDILINP